MTDEEIDSLRKDIDLMEEYLAKNDLEKLTEVNNDFHNKIRSSTRNPLIYNMLMNLAQFDYSFRKRALSYNQETELGVNEHRLIFEEIKQRDKQLAEKRTTDHIERTAKNVLQN